MDITTELTNLHSRLSALNAARDLMCEYLAVHPRIGYRRQYHLHSKTLNLLISSLSCRISDLERQHKSRDLRQYDGKNPVPVDNYSDD